MALYVYNSLSRRQEKFVPRDPDGIEVSLYCCGPTVHDFAHIGNFRTFVFVDLFCRYLEFRGYTVRHVMNVTDVEDKIIARVQTGAESLRDYTARYTSAFLHDLEVLGCRLPRERPHATAHVPDIIELIRRLMERGLAYQATDGSVYFSIERYKENGGHYGQLVALDPEKLRPGHRVLDDEYDKESISDFALWKARTPADGEVYWDSPWGQGRPGWHIECSAMSMKLLGPCFDVHAGGEDLIFPHHEDEIAQSEGAGLQPEGERFVKYWLHGAHLLVEGRKMSKSLNNFFTLRDLLERGFTGREIRFLLLGAHYRETFNFTVDGLSAARSALSRLDDCCTRLESVVEEADSEADPDEATMVRFTEVMDQDINVSAGWAVVFDWVRGVNRALDEGRMDRDRAAAQLAAWRSISGVFGITSPAPPEAPAEIIAMAEERQSARRERDFQRADALRDEVKRRGWIIEDTPSGPRLKRA